MSGGLLLGLACARLIGEHLSLELFGVTRFACWHDVSFLSDSSAPAVHNLGVTSGIVIRVRVPREVTHRHVHMRGVLDLTRRVDPLAVAIDQ